MYKLGQRIRDATWDESARLARLTKRRLETNRRTNNDIDSSHEDAAKSILSHFGLDTYIKRTKQLDSLSLTLATAYSI